MTREALPARRLSETFEFDHITPSYVVFPYKATVGYYMDGRPGEVFLSAAKTTTDMDTAARDAAILLSFALQFGAPAEAMRAAMSRDAEGVPMGVIGTLLDIMTGKAET